MERFNHRLDLFDRLLTEELRSIKTMSAYFIAGPTTGKRAISCFPIPVMSRRKNLSEDDGVHRALVIENKDARSDETKGGVRLQRRASIPVSAATVSVHKLMPAFSASRFATSKSPERRCCTQCHWKRCVGSCRSRNAADRWAFTALQTYKLGNCVRVQCARVSCSGLPHVDDQRLPAKANHLRCLCKRNYRTCACPFHC